MKPIELKAFAGVRNDIRPERFSSSDLQACVNIELDESGKPARRLGKTLIDDASPMHSGWANDEMCLMVRNGTMQRMFPDGTFFDYGVAIAGTRVRYTRIANDVFFSDGLQSGIISSTDGYRRWGIEVPSAPLINFIPGDLAAGTYLITNTFVRADGKEGGACLMQSVNIGPNLGLSLGLTAPADPTITERRIYVSEVNGELPLLIATVSASDTLCEITSLPAERTLPVRTLHCGPAPAGQGVWECNGRVYVAENNYLWYSDPYEFELFRLTMNFIGFTSPVRTFAPVSGGLFVGSDDETVFLKGSDPKDFSVEVVAPYGTIAGTETLVPPHMFGKGETRGQSPAAVWMSKQGLCAGLDGGQFMNLTGDRYTLPEGVSHGASLLKVRGGTPQVVTSLFS